MSRSFYFCVVFHSSNTWRSQCFFGPRNAEKLGGVPIYLSNWVKKKIHLWQFLDLEFLFQPPISIRGTGRKNPTFSRKSSCRTARSARSGVESWILTCRINFPNFLNQGQVCWKFGRLERVSGEVILGYVTSNTSHQYIKGRSQTTKHALGLLHCKTRLNWSTSQWSPLSKPSRRQYHAQIILTHPPASFFLTSDTSAVTVGVLQYLGLSCVWTPTTAWHPLARWAMKIQGPKRCLGHSSVGISMERTPPED